MIKLAGILLIVIVISTIIVTITKYVSNDKKNHFVRIVSQRTFWLRFKSIKGMSREIWIYGIHMMPKNFLTITIISTIALLVANKAKKQTYFYYISICILAFLSCILPLFFCRSGACGRVNVPTMMILGISSLILISTAISNNFEEIQSSKLKKCHFFIAPIFTILLFMINGMYIIQNTSEHIASNKVDSNMGATVNALIKKYEEENNITVTKFAYTYDEKPSQFAPNIKHMQSMTERKFGCEWSILYAMNYYCGRKFKKVQFEWPEEMISEPNSYFKLLNTDYNCFLEEQIFFRGDTVYMIVY